MRNKRITNNSCKRSINSTKGITLIALVVTIVVLLILAAVSISMLTGENGIIKQAKKAKEETEKARIEEQNKFGNLEDRINEIMGIPNYEDYEISATMTELYQYYVVGDTINGYQLKNNGEDYISISSKEELEYLSEYTNLSYITKNVTFVILNDIDLNSGTKIESNGIITGNTPEQWETIGKMEKLEIASSEEWDSKVAEYGKVYEGYKVSSKYETGKSYYHEISFKGKIDGIGHTIKGMYINEENKENSGLIGISDGAIIKNLIITNSYLYRGESSGLVIGKALGEGITIQNLITNDNYIFGDKRSLGGILGRTIEGNTKLENLTSKNTMDFKDTWDYWGTGGIIGYTFADETEIYDCCNKGRIYATDYSSDDWGGIIGQTRTILTMYNCYNLGELYASQENNVDCYVGGLIGQIGITSGKIYNCYNAGKINLFIDDSEHRGWDSLIGGLFGSVGSYDDGIQVYNCYNIGDVIFNWPEGQEISGKK